MSFEAYESRPSPARPPAGRGIARAWATLMQRLGYTRYVAQGGDWGNAVTENMAVQQPPGLLGIGGRWMLHIGIG